MKDGGALWRELMPDLAEEVARMAYPVAAVAGEAGPGEPVLRGLIREADEDGPAAVVAMLPADGLAHREDPHYAAFIAKLRRTHGGRLPQRVRSPEERAAVGDDDESACGSHVRALAEEFERHYRTHGVLPPAELMEAMTATARENDRLVEADARPVRRDGGAHYWRAALGDDALVEAMLRVEAA